ncbi:MAG TPA: diguanylate cyclase [Dehalococcoidales bacterium]
MKTKPLILVVDDQPQNIELLEAYLAPEGYETVKAANGEEALQTLSGNQIDLILLDVMMPGMDGFEVTRRVRQDAKIRLLPIILITALREKEDRIKGIEAGCDDFISKPVDKLELLARVRSLLKVKAYNDLMSNYRQELESNVTSRTEELKRAFERIKEASLDTIYRLSMASEYKDENTGAHIKRMSRYSAAVARRLGLSESAIETILYATPMHDLGKIGIPDLILVKPAKLDPLEWEIMKQHTVIGAKILKGSDAEFIKLGETIARHHHEKWDGSGYPGGLKGIEIPVEGRIAAIADVFDALTSKRPYKEPFPLDKSLAIIREGKGSHFDPAVVDAFFAVQDEILAIKKQYADDDIPAFAIPELKVLLQQYNCEKSPEEPKVSEVQRKKSEGLINTSELRYRRLFEAAREGILILDARTGQIVDINPFLIEMLGYSKEEFLGKKLWEIGPFKDIVASKQSFTDLQNKKYMRYENLPLERNDGKLINVEFVSSVYVVDNQEVIQCNIRDITERKIVEEALAQAAERDSAFSILAGKLFSSISIADISEPILESAERFTRSTHGFVGYVDMEKGYLVSPSMIRGTWESSQGTDELGIFKKSEGSWGWVLNNRQSFIINGPADDLKFVETPLGNAPIHNLLSAPALIGTELVGHVVIANSSRDYNQQDLKFIERLATLFAIAIQHQRSEDKIRKLAYYDLLTGLPNRALFNDRYNLALARARRYHLKIVLMVLDIDHFKNINDTLGHAAGDEVLRDFSRLLVSILRKADTIMRLGGDEFVIMITDMVELEHIATVAQKVLEATRKPIMFHGHEVRITTSIGISTYPEDGEDLEVLLKYADIAMYHVKATQRDNYACYVPGMQSQVLE